MNGFELRVVNHSFNYDWSADSAEVRSSESIYHYARKQSSTFNERSRVRR